MTSAPQKEKVTDKNEKFKGLETSVRFLYSTSSSFLKENTEDKADTFHYMREMREKYKIKISKDKTMHFDDFFKSLDVDPKRFHKAHHRKSCFNAYVHFLDVELEHAAIEKGTLKWT